MTYRPTRAPARRVYHQSWRTSYIANSQHGAIAAREAGCRWTDNDFHLTKRGADWGNDHGYPSQFWFDHGDRMERHPSSYVFALHKTVGGHDYHVRSLRETFEDNHHNGLGTEVEVKDIHPWATPAILNARFAELAATAQAVYGDNWRAHVVVKVLTNLSGGEQYALRICRRAHAHGIPTMLLVRGRCRLKRYIGHPEITWVRGSAVIR
jgi:hypothetical protein